MQHLLKLFADKMGAPRNVILSWITTFLCFFSFPMAFASDSELDLPFMDFLSRLANTLTGPVARTIGIIAIIFAAFGLFSGNAGEGFKKVLWVVIGLSLATWAPTLAGMF